MDCPPTQTPTQKLKYEFSTLKSQEISSILISFLMIFKALQAELFRIKTDSLGKKIPKFPEFNLIISHSSKIHLPWTRSL